MTAKSILNYTMYKTPNTVPLVYIIYDIVLDLADPSSKITNDRICWCIATIHALRWSSEGSRLHLSYYRHNLQS